MITPTQCKMARAALDWTTKALAVRAGLGINTVSRFEQGKETLSGNLAKIEAAFSPYVSFIPENGDGPGVRLRKLPRYEGSLGYDRTFQLSTGDLVSVHLQWGPQSGEPILCVSPITTDGKLRSHPETYTLARTEIPEVEAIYHMPKDGGAYYIALIELLVRFGFDLIATDRNRVLSAMAKAGG